MKLLSACVFAIALVFRAAPLCASPVSANVEAAMPDCGDATGHHGDEQNHDAGRVCHTCLPPPITRIVFFHPAPLVAVPYVDTIAPVTGGMIEPPTPPPRAASVTIIQHFTGVIS